MSQAFTSRWLVGAAVIMVMGCAGPAHAETLEEAVARAVATFPVIQTGAANRRAAIAAISEARAEYYPTIDTTLGYGRQRTDNINTRSLPGGEVTINPREARVSITQLVYDGGAVSSQVRLQESRSESRAYDLANTAQTTALRAARAYLEVLRLRSVIEIAQANVAVHQQTLQQVALLADQGAGRRSDAQQAVARLALARSSLTALRGQSEQAESEYRRLMGLPPPLQMEKPTDPLEKLPRSEQTALEEALDNHPALKASNADLAVARADLQASRARYIPRVNIELSASQNDNIGGVPGTESDRIAALRLHYNVFKGGADSAHIRLSEAQVDKSLADVADVRNDLEREVRVAWEALDADREQLTYLQIHADVSVDVVAAYRAQFKLGQRTLLDVLNAENELYSARSALVNGVYAVAADNYRLFAGTGHLLEVLGVPLPQEAHVGNK